MSGSKGRSGDTFDPALIGRLVWVGSWALTAGCGWFGGGERGVKGVCCVGVGWVGGPCVQMQNVSGWPVSCRHKRTAKPVQGHTELTPRRRYMCVLWPSEGKTATRPKCLQGHEETPKKMRNERNACSKKKLFNLPLPTLFFRSYLHLQARVMLFTLFVVCPTIWVLFLGLRRLLLLLQPGPEPRLL